MVIQDGHQRKLDKLTQRLKRWREQWGGPGRRIPDDFWAEAAAIARVVGVETVARSLRMAPAKLVGWTELEGSSLLDSEASERPQFVEVDTSRLRLNTRAVVRLEARDGERLEVEISDATALDVVALASAFWTRRR